MKMRLWSVAALALLVACKETPTSRGDAASPRDARQAETITATDATTRADAAATADAARDAAAADASAIGVTLSASYPGDEGIAGDPAVLFHDDFEQGWGKWDAPRSDTKYLHIESNVALADGGTRYLRSTVTKADLEADDDTYISSSTHYTFPRRVDRVYWRFYARFKGIAPNPHHWVRMSAGDEDYWSSGRANVRPEGYEGFWFDFDVNNDDVFNFYVYWYLMRSGRCNDGTAIPGCDGDQERTYYYGNVFRPPDQTPYTHDQWFCVEIGGKTNTLGTSDGELAFWIDDQLIDEYKPGHPIGTWLRAQFYTGGCEFTACTEPVPFEGFDFRSDEAVRFKRIFLDAYYQLNTFESKKAALEGMGLTVSDEMTIYYDDVVVATERIGCKVGR
jgi:hypothetical protein